MRSEAFDLGLGFIVELIMVSFTNTNYSPGSVGFDYVATFNDTNGINNKIIQKELASSINITKNGTFLGEDLQISKETNLTKVANLFAVQGKSANSVSYYFNGIDVVILNSGSTVCISLT